MRLQVLEKMLSERLSAPLVVVRSDKALKTTQLSKAECERFENLGQARRRSDWLRGRNALKQLLAALDRSSDTTALTFPHQQISLTHADDAAFACGTAMDSVGMGIDYEPYREVNHRVARWFLNEAEIDWLNEQPEYDRGAQIVRLWTVKEAAFKSHPHNAEMTLMEFSIIDPEVAVTNIVASGRGAYIQVACCAYEAGYLSVANLGESP